MNGPIDRGGNLFDRQIIEIPENQDQSMYWREFAQQLDDTSWTFVIEIMTMLFSVDPRPDQGHPSLLARCMAIVINEFVPSHPDNPRHRLRLGATGVDGGNYRRERLLCQILGEGTIAEDGAKQVVVDLTNRTAVERDKSIPRRVLSIPVCCVRSHDPFLVQRRLRRSRLVENVHCGQPSLT
jgi:hypothetical protein